MRTYYLGIDTSCYTTSCAIIDNNGCIIGEARKLLDVKPGMKGLQQSNMVFQHTKVLSRLLEELPQVPITSIGVSAFPRREESSYMPAFLVGHGMARGIGHLLQVPVYEFSHQENHILAALRLIDTIPTDPFLSLHVSGGTTELALYHYTGKGIFTSSIVGGSKDLQGGQFIDRVGVALGLQFPAGRTLEQLAVEAIDYDPLPSSVKDGWVSFAGPCSEALRRIEKGVVPSSMAKSLFSCIGNSLEKLLSYHIEKLGIHTLIAVGGVMSNSILRNRINGMCHKKQVAIHFAEPYYSVDNATGNAFGALLASGDLR